MMRDECLTYRQFEFLMSELGYRPARTTEEEGRFWKNEDFDALKYLPDASPEERVPRHHLITLHKVSVEKESWKRKNSTGCWKRRGNVNSYPCKPRRMTLERLTSEHRVAMESREHVDGATTTTLSCSTTGEVDGTFSLAEQAEMQAFVRSDAIMRALDRETLCARYDFQCGYCGLREVDAGAELTADHFQPRSQGGSDALANLVSCCHACNEFKGDY